MNQSDQSPKLTAAEVLERYSEGYPDFCDPLTDVNQVGTFGNHPLDLASYHGDVEAMKALIESGAKVNVPGEMGETPLHSAVQSGNAEAVRLLLQYGARTDVHDEFGKLPVDNACGASYSEIVNLLSGK